MKKLFCLLLFFMLISIGNTKASTSENFQKVLSLINVPNKNIDGYEINEDIYRQYSLIVYGSPSDISKNQRWKDTENGKWINEKTGKKGEYRILGYNLTGTVVNNELFPDDYTSGISPEEWNYIVVPNALASWNDTEKYQTKEQYEYMLSQKLSRNGVTYNLTASSIGLDKARIEAYATWQSAGSIYTEKIDAKGAIWEATFRVPPIASDAKLNAKLDITNGLQYHLTENEDTLEIPFSFGAKATNLGEYARAEDITNIVSTIEIENNLYDKVQAEHTTNISKENKIVIRSSEYPDVDRITMTIRNTSVLETCFHSEVPFVDIQEATIEIIFREEEKEQVIEVKDSNKKYDNEMPRPVFQNIKLYRKSISNKSNKVTLFIAKKTNTRFICAGQILVLECQVFNSPDLVTFAIEGNASIQTADSLTKRFVYEEPKARGEKLIYSSLTELKSSYDLPRVIKANNGVYQIEYLIPYGTKQTLHSWATLREENGNAISIDKTKLFSRIKNPYQIKLYAKNSGGTRTVQIALDVFERWDTLYNRNLEEYIK